MKTMQSLQWKPTYIFPFEYSKLSEIANKKRISAKGYKVIWQ